MATTNTRLMNTKELADYLSVSASTVKRLARDQQIPVIRVRTRVRFDPEAVVLALTEDNYTQETRRPVRSP